MAKNPLKKAKKKAKKAEELRKQAEKEAKKAAKKAKKARKAVKGAVDAIGDVDLKMSQKANALAQDARKKLKKFEDNMENAINDIAVGQILERLAKEVLKDNKKLIKQGGELFQAVQKVDGLAEDLRVTTPKVIEGEIKEKAAGKKVKAIIAKVGLD